MLAAGVEIVAGWAPGSAAGGQLTVYGCDEVFDDDGRFAPRIDRRRTQVLPFDHVILAVGQEMDPGLRSALLGELGTPSIEVEPGTQRVVGRARTFAGGDLVRGAGTIVEAVADGRRAAVAIHEQLGAQRGSTPIA